MSGFSDAPGNPQSGWTTVLGQDGEMIEVYAVEGSDPTIPPEVRKAHLQERVDALGGERRRVADLLLQRLIVDGIEHQIQLEDIEALCAMEKTPRGRSPMLMRQVIIEFLAVLHKEREESKEKEEIR